MEQQREGGERDPQGEGEDLGEEEGPSPGRGLFDIKYQTLTSIGKGAFGFVKLAQRKIDEEEVLYLSLIAGCKIYNLV